MSDNTRLGRALAEEERNNPEVAEAARKFDEVRDKIISKPLIVEWETLGGSRHRGTVREVDSNVLVVDCEDGYRRSVEMDACQLVQGCGDGCPGCPYCLRPAPGETDTPQEPPWRGPRKEAQIYGTSKDDIEQLEKRFRRAQAHGARQVISLVLGLSWEQGNLPPDERMLGRDALSELNARIERYVQDIERGKLDDC